MSCISVSDMLALMSCMSVLKVSSLLLPDHQAPTKDYSHPVSTKISAKPRRDPQVERLVASDSWQARAKAVAIHASRDFQQGLPPKMEAAGPLM